MNRVFADSYYFIALLNERDAAHHRAVGFSRNFRGGVITTRWILAEVADALCRKGMREGAARFLAVVHTLPSIQVLADSDALFDEGLELYCRRPDKEWSLTDCISFRVMSDMGLAEALTGDRHFEQAGFIALLTED